MEPEKWTVVCFLLTEARNEGSAFSWVFDIVMDLSCYFVVERCWPLGVKLLSLGNVSVSTQNVRCCFCRQIRFEIRLIDCEIPDVPDKYIPLIKHSI